MPNPPRSFRKKPVVIEACQWAGGDYEWLTIFCGQNWSRADVHDMAYDDPEQVIVFNSQEQQWLHVPVGHWLIRGIKGELYPCSPDVFKATYEPV
jgi:hypothetical protein